MHPSDIDSNRQMDYTQRFSAPAMPPLMRPPPMDLPLRPMDGMRPPMLIPGSGILPHPIIHPSHPILPPPHPLPPNINQGRIPGAPVPFPQHPGFMAYPPIMQTPLTIFVGKLPIDIHDNYVRNLLEKCGKVILWRRSTDPVTGKGKGFGYCTYASQGDVLRALRLLNGFIIDSKEMLVKADSKTQALLDEYESFLSQAQLDHEQIRDEEIRKELQALYDERSGLHGGHQNAMASWGELITSKEQQNPEVHVEEGKQKEVVRGKMIMSEIEKFRYAQEQREKNLERKRKDLIQEKMKKTTVANDKPANEDNIPSTTPTNKPPKLSAYEKEEDKQRPSKYSRRQRYDDNTSYRHRSNDNDRRQRGNNNDYDKKGIQHDKYDDSDFNSSRKHDYNSKFNSEGAKSKLIIDLNSGGTTAKLKKEKSVTGTTGFSPAVFAATDEVETKPIRPIVPLDYSEAERISYQSKIPPEETDDQSSKMKYTNFNDKPVQIKNSQVKELIDQIPVDKKGLFSYPIDWEKVEKMKPWIVKKVVEYLGEEEPTLVSFIVAKLTQRCSPEALMEELLLVLEEDAEVFVKVLWRKLIFEFLRG